MSKKDIGNPPENQNLQDTETHLNNQLHYSKIMSDDPDFLRA